MQRFLGSGLALALWVAVSGPVKADYVFTTIDVPGSTSTAAYGINLAADGAAA
jgi:hypothetical protein